MCACVCLCVCVCACVVQPEIFSNNFIISCGACVGPHTNKCRLMSRLVFRNMVFACLGLCIACFYNPHNTPTTPQPSLFVVWSFAMCHLLFIICLLMFVYYFTTPPHTTPTQYPPLGLGSGGRQMPHMSPSSSSPRPMGGMQVCVCVCVCTCVCACVRGCRSV